MFRALAAISVPQSVSNAELGKAEFSDQDLAGVGGFSYGCATVAP